MSIREDLWYSKYGQTDGMQTSEIHKLITIILENVEKYKYKRLCINFRYSVQDESFKTVEVQTRNLKKLFHWFNIA